MFSNEIISVPVFSEEGRIYFMQEGFAPKVPKLSDIRSKFNTLGAGTIYFDSFFQLFSRSCKKFERG